jgi:hypothetical protein
MSEWLIRAVKQGNARFQYNRKRGIKNKDRTIKEWIGPRCLRLGTRKSMSGRMEARNNKGIFTFTLRILDDAFPHRYPRARCPTANMKSPSFIFRKYLWSSDTKRKTLLQE